MKQPKGFEDDTHPDHVYKLKKAIYGLKQALWQWFNTFSKFLCTLGFISGKVDSSLFVLHKGNVHLYTVIYVDDILITGNDSSMIATVLSQLQNKFDMKNLGMASSFLGIHISSVNNTYVLSQTNYAASILNMAGMTNCKALANPSCTKVQDHSNEETLPTDPKLCRQLTGSLQYLTITRPDISFAVNLLCQHMHNSNPQHFYLLYRLLCYIKGTLSLGLHILQGPMELHSYSDVNLAGDKETQRSTSGYCTFLGNTFISGASKSSTL
ncbi:hypothetical protein KFK09_009781 [Dendrobium nobile]|uniref:Reverse transcriptase Ty1/copia-type domain-containing protein n=1 Tax=Dendrobium nobile TaxID=94219 RepID=A0A8T3BKG4_DENNO|nr:hypothetical protein KFK09_009781 [Dendrobium nobile]